MYDRFYLFASRNLHTIGRKIGNTTSTLKIYEVVHILLLPTCKSFTIHLYLFHR